MLEAGGWQLAEACSCCSRCFRSASLAMLLSSLADSLAIVPCTQRVALAICVHVHIVHADTYILD